MINHSLHMPVAVTRGNSITIISVAKTNVNKDRGFRMFMRVSRIFYQLYHFLLRSLTFTRNHWRNSLRRMTIRRDEIQKTKKGLEKLELRKSNLQNDFMARTITSQDYQDMKGRGEKDLVLIKDNLTDL